MAISIINLEAGMPTVELARSRLNQGLQSARMRGEKAVKIIHGYGSTGRGGKIKADTLGGAGAEAESRAHPGLCAARSSPLSMKIPGASPRICHLSPEIRIIPGEMTASPSWYFKRKEPQRWDKDQSFLPPAAGNSAGF